MTMYVGETSPVGNGTWPDNGETDIEEVSSDRPDRPGMERQTSTNSFAGRLSKRGSEIALVIKVHAFVYLVLIVPLYGREGIMVILCAPLWVGGDNGHSVYPSMGGRG